MDKKRIAVCFYGQTRTFDIIDKTYRKLNSISDNLEFDFFVATWKEFDNISSFDFFTKTSFVDVKISQQLNLECGETASYLITKVNNLKVDYELENNFIYDYCILTVSNFDISGDVGRILHHIEDRSTSPTLNQIDVFGGMGIDPQNKSVLSVDYFFTGTSFALDIYSLGWKKYFKVKNSFDNYNLHNYHADILKYNNLDYYIFPGLDNSKLLYNQTYVETNGINL